jgi:hypothetical protein
MSLRDVIGAAGLGQRYGSGVQIFAWQRALLEQVLPAVEELLLRV